MEARDREAACLETIMPVQIAAELSGYRWTRNTSGQSGSTVYRLEGGPGASDLFLKHGRGALADEIGAEQERLRWLARHLPVPTVRHFVRTSDEAWLLATAVPGKTADEVLQADPGRRLAIVDELASFLRRLHAISVNDCPFDSHHAGRLVHARARIDAGLVEEDDFDPERSGWTAEQVWDAMQALLPLARDLVVTHGDFSLDNVFIHEGRVAGCIDAGRVGIADRYQDLSIMWNCLGQFGASLQARFLEKYGLAVPDRHKLQFHLLLDELF